MIFSDKSHFKMVLKDFCVQEGFPIVVKVENKRYTTVCAPEGCPWRIHASKLPDGISWAIKAVNNVHEGCTRLQIHNSMALVTWVAGKLMDDIILTSL